MVYYSQSLHIPSISPPVCRETFFTSLVAFDLPPNMMLYAQQYIQCNQSSDARTGVYVERDLLRQYFLFSCQCVALLTRPKKKTRHSDSRRTFSKKEIYSPSRRLQILRRVVRYSLPPCRRKGERLQTCGCSLYGHFNVRKS